MMARLVSSNLRSFGRDRQALFFTFGFPLVMSFLFGLGVSSDLKPLEIVVVQESRNRVATGFIELVKSSKQFEIEHASTKTEAIQRLEEGRLNGVLVIPDLTKESSISLLFDERSPERVQRTTSLISGILQSYNLQLAQAPPRLSLRVQGIRAREGLGDFDFMLPVLIMLGVIFSSMTGAASKMAGFREQGAFKRLIVTPLQPIHFLQGDLISRALIALPQIALILAVGRIQFDATVLGNGLWIFVLGLIGTMIFASLGVLIANYSRSAEAAGGIASGVSTFMLFLGGLFPQDMFPKRVTEALALTPFPLIIDKIRTVVLDAKVPFATDLETSMLALWFVGSVALAARTFRFKEPSRRSVKKKKGIL